MKISNKLVKSILCVWLMSISLWAVSEDHGKPPPCDRDGMNRLISSLNVSADVETQVKDILQAEKEKRREIHQQYRSSREEEKQAMDKLHDDTISQLSEVLSESQLAQFKTFTKNHRPPRPKF